MDEDWRKQAHQQIRGIISKTAEMLGVEAELEIRNGYPVLINDPLLSQQFKLLMTACFGTASVKDIPEWMAAEDFAYYSHCYPSLFFLVGIKGPLKSVQYGLHNAKFDLDEQAFSTPCRRCPWAVSGFSMMKTDRRKFIASAGALGLASLLFGPRAFSRPLAGKRVGIVGLDSSHAIAFTKELNASQSNNNYKGYHVVAAYPLGNPDIPLNGKRIPVYSDEMKKLGIKVVKNLTGLLCLVDVVLLETNDGNMHLEQAEVILKAGKPVFIDKPIANSYSDAFRIFSLAERYHVPVFSTSSLRYIQGLHNIDKKTILGADVYSPAHVEPSHKDLYWYGIHGVEMLFALLGPDCKSVQTTHTVDYDIYVGKWSGGRVGTLRGTRKGIDAFGGTVFTDAGTIILGAYQGYAPLLREIVAFFESRKSPVQKEETLTVCRFIDAAFESKLKNGEEVRL